MHTGTADAGHYYSFINIKDDKWVEFNDSLIKPFDVNKLEDECFGGSDSNDNDYWDN